MRDVTLDAMLRHLKKLAATQAAKELSDAELLERFRAHREEAAFTILVQRHGPMVLGVCRRVLANLHDAEDAFQATFLVLATRAASIRKQQCIGSWLHGVAHRVAIKERARSSKRRTHEIRSKDVPSTDPLDERTWQELRTVLHEELGLLPEKYRAPVVLCYLEGKTNEQASLELGCPKGSISARLGRARELLRERLQRRGVALSAGTLATLLPGEAASAGTPAGLVIATVNAAVQYVSGSTLAGGAVSAKVLAITQGTVKAMSLSKITHAVVLGVAMAAGFGGLASLGRKTELPTATAQMPPKREADRSVANAERPRNDLYGDPLPQGAIARIGTARLRHEGSTAVLTFSADARRMAYGSAHGIIHVCEADDGKPLFEMQPDGVRFQPVTELAFSPDGRTLAAGGYWSPEVRLVDLDTRKVRRTILNTVNGQSNWAREWQGPGFAFTPDGGTLVVGGKDGTLHLCNTATGDEHVVQTEANRSILSLMLTADGRTALTAHFGGALNLWDVKNRKHLRRLAMTAKYPHLTALSSSRKTLVLATSATELELWDPEGGRRHQIHAAAPVVGLGFMPDGGSLRVAEGNGNVVTWDTATGKKLKSLTCDGISLLSVNDRMGPKTSAWFRPDGRAMAWAINGTIRPWDLGTGLESPRLSVYRQGIQWAGFSADGRLLRACATTGEFGLWDPETGRAQVPPRNTGLAARARYTPAHDRNMVVAVIDADYSGTRPKPAEGSIFLWDPSGDAKPLALREQAGPASFAALTPDNRFVVATEPAGLIRVYDAASGKRTRSFTGRKYEYHPTFSLDGTTLGTTGAAERTIQLYDFASGRLLRELKAQHRASCLAFSPDGRSLASGHITTPFPGEPAEHARDTICVWDTTSGREVRRIHTGNRDVHAVSYSIDGRLIASCGSDNLVQLWEVSSGQERRRYDGHRGAIQSVDFAPDDRRLASASLDGTALVWQVFDLAPADRSAVDLEALWADLAKDGITAHRALAALFAAKDTARFLSVRVKPAVKPSAGRLETWFADLSSPSFNTREAAQKEIANVADMVEPILRRTLDGAADAEVRRRLTILLDRICRPETRPDHLRDLRAVELLERLNTPEARRLLRELTKGAPEARLTREAQASLARLERRR